MGFELKPGQLINSLNRATWRLNTIKDIFLDPLRISIRGFIDADELHSLAYDGLKSGLTVFFTRAIQDTKLAIDSIVEANDRHLEALDVVSQYPVLNQNQIDGEIEQLEGAIRSLVGLPGMVPSVLEGMNGRLRYLTRKRTDFMTYLSNSSGIYSDAATSLTPADFGISSFNLGSFCMENNRWFFPSNEVIDSFIRNRELELEAQKELAYLIVDGEVNWDLVAEMLGGCYTNITEAQFLALANVMNSFDCYEDLTRFYHLMMLRIDAIDYHWMGLGAVEGEWIIPAWQLNMRMMEGLMWGLEVMSSQVISQLLSAESLGLGENDIELLMNTQNNILNRFGTLIVLYDMQYAEGFMFTTNAPYERGSLPDDIFPNFAISSTDARNVLPGNTLTFAGITSRMVEVDPQSAFIPQQLHISHTLFGEQQLRTLAEISFNPSSTGSLLFGTSFSYATGKVIAQIPVLSYFRGLLSAVESNEREAANLEVFVDSGLAVGFGLYSVAITDELGIIRRTIQFPSHLTQGYIDSFNASIESLRDEGSLFMDNHGLSENGITWSDFQSNPGGINDVWYHHLNEGGTATRCPVC